MRPISFRRPIRVCPNGTTKKRPIRVCFRVLVHYRLETDPNGTFSRIYLLRRLDMKIGYIRVSTQEQNIIRQEVLMESLGWIKYTSTA